jgi:hypothetical protein
MTGEAGRWRCWSVAGAWAPGGISNRVGRLGWRDHEVSILIAAMGAVGRYCGEQPRAKISMMIMRPPQQGQGCFGVCGSLASVLAALMASIGSIGIASSSRARAMFSARVALASRP